MAVTIRLRRAPAGDWTVGNPTLALGEMGVETDTRKFKFGNGTDAWNDLDYGSGSGAGVRCGSTTLASGSATVTDTQVSARTVVVVTPQAAPSTPGTALYVDPASYVEGVSFDISSDDVADARAVSWMAADPDTLAPLALPTTFYVSFEVTFSADEITADDSSPMFEIGNIGASDSISFLADFSSGTQWQELFIQLNSGSQSYAVLLDSATPYTFDLKFEFAGDYSTCTVTPRLDGTPLVEGAVTASTGFGSILAFALGATSGFSNTDKKDFDFVTIGTSTWGDSDLFDCQFTELSPFDTQSGSGISIGSGLLSIDKSGGPAYVLKNCA